MICTPPEANDLIAIVSFQGDKNGKRFNRFTCTVKSSYTYSLTRPFYWTAVLVEVYKHGRTVRSTPLPCERYMPPFTLLGRDQIYKHKLAGSKLAACLVAQHILCPFVGLKMHRSGCGIRHVVPLVPLWAPSTSVDILLQGQSPGLETAKLRHST